MNVSVFIHSQFYVAISRVREKDGMKILAFDNKSKCMNSTINMIYKKVFNNIQ